MIVTFHKNDKVFVGEVPENSNLVVRAGVKKYPFPYLNYGCGMGKCGKCACRVLVGAGALPAPNWKEEKVLAERLGEGMRLMCQLWLSHDIALEQA